MVTTITIRGRFLSANIFCMILRESLIIRCDRIVHHCVKVLYSIRDRFLWLYKDIKPRARISRHLNKCQTATTETYKMLVAPQFFNVIVNIDNLSQRSKGDKKYHFLPSFIILQPLKQKFFEKDVSEGKKSILRFQLLIMGQYSIYIWKVIQLETFHDIK